MRTLALFLATLTLVSLVAVLPPTSDVGWSQAVQPTTTTTTSKANETGGNTTGTTAAHPGATTVEPTPAPGATYNTTEPLATSNTTEPTRTGTPLMTSKEAPKNESDYAAGDFETREALIDGLYLRFLLDLENCAVTHVSLEGVLIFNEVELGGERCEGADASKEEVGARYRLASTAGEILLFDHASGFIRFDAAVVRFDVADGFDFTTPEVGVGFTDGNFEGLIVLDGGAAPPTDNGDVFAKGAGNALFRVAELRQGTETVGDVEAELLSEGRLGGRIDILHDPSGEATPAALPMSDVVIQADVRADDHVKIRVTADLDEGRAFLAAFPPGAFRDDRIEVRYWTVDAEGREVQGTIRRLATVDDVLASPEPAYTVLREGDAVTVVLNVAHWSTHIFEVLHIPAQAAPIVLYGVVFLALFASTGVLGLALGWRARRRRLAQRRSPKRAPDA